MMNIPQLRSIYYHIEFRILSMRKHDKHELFKKLKEIGNIDKVQKQIEKSQRDLLTKSNTPSQHNDAAQIDLPKIKNKYLMSKKNYISLQNSILEGDDAEQSKDIDYTSLRSDLSHLEIKEKSQKPFNFFINLSQNDKDFDNSVISNNQKSIPALNPRFSNRTAINKIYSQDISTLLNSERNPKKNANAAKVQHLQNMVSIKNAQIDKLKKVNQKASQDFDKFLKSIQKIKEAVKPYISNVSLLASYFQSIRMNNSQLAHSSSLPQLHPHIHSQIKNIQTKIQNQKQPQKSQKQKQASNFLTQERRKQKQYKDQIMHLKYEIDQLKIDKEELQYLLEDKNKELIKLKQILLLSVQSSSYRQRMEMCNQQLYAYKLKLQILTHRYAKLQKIIEKNKQRFKTLTSLIGSAIICDTRQKDRLQIHEFMKSLAMNDKVVSKHLTADRNGLGYLKEKKIKQQTKEKVFEGIEKESFSGVAFMSKRLFKPNFMIFLGEDAIFSKVQMQLIKPSFFILIRALLDSRYQDIMINPDGTPSFAQFTNGFLKNYNIIEKEKKLYLNSRSVSEIEVKAIYEQFARRLFDGRISNLPQIITLREFIFNQTDKDEIFFYLSCRNKLLQGGELENYVTAGDPSKFIRYEFARRIIMKIAERFGKKAKNFICQSLNDKRITKGKIMFVKLYYFLRILLQVYRKYKFKRIQALKLLFQETLGANKSPILEFTYFYQLIKKNFDFLLRNQICAMYRNTLSVFKLQKPNCTFFEAFQACCIPEICYQQLLNENIDLETECRKQYELLVTKDTINSTKQRRSIFHQINNEKLSYFQSLLKNNEQNDKSKGILTELWPNSIYNLGSESLNKEYNDLMKSDSSQMNAKILIISLLIKTLMGQHTKAGMYMHNYVNISNKCDEIIVALIDCLNKIEKGRLKDENNINLASARIGKAFKKRVYEFYQQFIDDINVSLDKMNKSKGTIRRRRVKNAADHPMPTEHEIHQQLQSYKRIRPHLS